VYQKKSCKNRLCITHQKQILFHVQKTDHVSHNTPTHSVIPAPDIHDYNNKNDDKRVIYDTSLIRNGTRSTLLLFGAKTTLIIFCLYHIKKQIMTHFWCVISRGDNVRNSFFIISTEHTKTHMIYFLIHDLFLYLTHFAPNSSANFQSFWSSFLLLWGHKPEKTILTP